MTACSSSQHNLYDIYLLLFIQYLTPDDGQKTCLKHVDFYSKNKFEKLVHLVGFIIRIYHNAWSSECQSAHIMDHTDYLNLIHSFENKCIQRIIILKNTFKALYFAVTSD